MGIISHNAIIVTDNDGVWIDDAATKARALGCIVLGPSAPGTNAYRTLVICPDGSKEGWGTSNEGDERRNAFVNWLYSQRERYPDWVEVRYGEYGYNVVRSDECVSE